MNRPAHRLHRSTPARDPDSSPSTSASPRPGALAGRATRWLLPMAARGAAVGEQGGLVDRAVPVVRVVAAVEVAVAAVEVAAAVVGLAVADRTPASVTTSRSASRY